MASHLASLWKWDFFEPGNGLLSCLSTLAWWLWLLWQAKKWVSNVAQLREYFVTFSLFSVNFLTLTYTSQFHHAEFVLPLLDLYQYVCFVPYRSLNHYKSRGRACVFLVPVSPNCRCQLKGIVTVFLCFVPLGLFLSTKTTRSFSKHQGQIMRNFCQNLEVCIVYSLRYLPYLFNKHYFSSFLALLKTCGTRTIPQDNFY